MPTITCREELQRLLYFEFLRETKLYREVGLDELPARLAALLDCDEDRAIGLLLKSERLDPLSLDQLKTVLAIRDMAIVSRTASAVAAQLKDSHASYHRCCQVALIYAVVGSASHVFSALRVAATIDDSFARHHYLYGLMLGLAGDYGRAIWELSMALAEEPYEDSRQRLRRVLLWLAGS